MKKTILISILILLLDIITKQLVITNLLEHQSITIINNFFSITYAKNTGVAFSFLEGYLPLVILITSIIIISILIYIKKNTPNKYESICYGLILGGALGNLLDRIIYGYVIDFLDFTIFNYNYPIFNIADTFIVIGILILIILSFKENKGSEKNETNSNRKIKNR